MLVNVHLAWSPVSCAALRRRQLTRQVAELIRAQGLDSIFVDVSQYIHNSDNGVLENLTYPQGSLKLMRELAELARGIGYHYGSGANRRPMIDATLKQGAIPTLIFRSEDPVQELAGEEAQYILERALS